jgi:O-antigen/teichoic acid export membrane protein
VLSDPATDGAEQTRPRDGRSLGAAVVLLTLVRGVSVIAGFLTSVLAARLIGADGLGLAGTAFTIATAGALLSSGGLNIAAIYFLGRRPGEQREMVARILTLGAAAVLLAALSVVLGSLLLGAAILSKADGVLIGAAAALGGSILAFELFGGVMLGLHLRNTYIAVQALESLGALGLTALLLLAIAPSAAGYLVAAALAYAGSTIVGGAAVRRHLGPIRPAYSRSFAREALGMGLRGQVGNVLQYLSLRLDLILVAALLDLTSAGIYFVAVRVSEVVTQVANSAAAFLFPQVAAQTERQSTQVTEQVTRLTILTVVAGGFVLGLLAEPLLRIAFGSEFVAGVGAVRLTLLAMLPLTVTRLLSGDLKGRGRPGLVSWAALAGLFATVSLDLLLIPWLGIVGAALASLLSYTAVAVVMLVAYRRITGSRTLALLPRWSDIELLARVVRTRGRLAGSP